MAAYNSVASLAKAIDEIKNLFSVREYEESLKPINDYATSLLPLLEYSPTKNIRLRELLSKAEEKMIDIELENDERISISIEKDVIEALLEDSERLNWRLIKDSEAKIMSLESLSEAEEEMIYMELENDERISISIEKDVIEAVLEDSERLNWQWLSKDSEAKIMSLEMRVRELANKANDSIQFFIGSIKSSAGRWSRFKLKRRMRKVGEEMKSMVGEIKMVMNILKMEDEISIVDTNQPSTFAPIDKLFGLDNDLKRIKETLLDSAIWSGLCLFSIVGSGGSGKTSFARYIYNDPETVKHFQIRVWVTVSQDFSPIYFLRNVLLSLGQILDLSGILSGLQSNNYRQMESLVRQLLYKKRYLIVMDDVYTTQVWDYAKSLFPDDCKGSRIILTTRNLDVAAHFYPYPHKMKLMDDDQSWYLLCNKVFGEEGCPLEFEPLGRKIARGCEGLPLSIVTMADLLSSIPMNLNFWEAISEDIISAICTKDSQLEKIMLWSFNELPHHLRQCLLYMGGFPKNHELGVPELIKLWVAEGFIKPNGSKTFEEVAEEYVEDLVKRNLVKVIGRKKKNGKIKSYSLPNLVRDFCMRKIQEHKFLLPVMDYLSDTTLRRFFLPKCLKTQRRVILGSYDLHLKEAIDNSPMRTIICIKQGEYLPRASAQKFPLLRILHDKSDNLGWESDHIFELIHLRYLASNILSSSIPASISKLQKLQTLIIYRHNVHLPEEIWSLTRLRHLIAFSFHPLPHPKVATSPLESLQTLSLASNFEISKTIQKMIPNLKSLEICYSDDTSEQDYQLNNLANLHLLENLKLEVHKDLCFRRKLSPGFPVQLKKISLSGCRLPWKDMTILGSLHSLEVLKLRNYAFQGDKWEIKGGEFSNLKYLLIDESDLRFWSFSRHHYFGELVCLLLYRCPYLRDIPYEIRYGFELELLEVDGGNEFLVKAAESILEVQHSRGNKSFRFQVKHF